VGSAVCGSSVRDITSPHFFVLKGGHPKADDEGLFLINERQFIALGRWALFTFPL